MHLTYLFPRMDEASNLLEYITVPRQWLPTGYLKLSLEIPLVDKVVDPVPSLFDPNLALESEEEIVHPTLPLKSEVKVVESMSSPPNPTPSSKSVNIKVVSSTQS